MKLPLSLSFVPHFASFDLFLCIHLQGLGSVVSPTDRPELKITLSVLSLLQKFSDNQVRIVTRIGHATCIAKKKWLYGLEFGKKVPVYSIPSHTVLLPALYM